jgi:hypothetical protein
MMPLVRKVTDAECAANPDLNTHEVPGNLLTGKAPQRMAITGWVCIKKLQKKARQIHAAKQRA